MEQRPNTQSTQGLLALSEARDLKVADGNEDIRGWEIRAQNGEKVGKVKDLIVDPSAMKTRYIDAELGGGFFGKDRRVLIPVGAARLADDDDVVIVNLDREAIEGIPAYEGRGLTPEYERTLRDRLKNSFGRTSSDFDERFHNEQGLFGTRRSPMDDRDEVRVTRAEEELAVGKRRVQAGEAYLRKTVETEHVSQPVTRMREEVTVERRPVNEASAGHVEIGEDEIRVPVTEEEVVVEKRPVVKEEIVVKKRAVQDTETVEADVRRERVDVDDSQVRNRGGTGRAGKKPLGDRAVDAVDDVKDRIDGNPASRPGPDATDRR